MSEQERVLDLVRAQRHEFLNHLQVLSGWLQMGLADRAQAYLRHVASRLEAEGRMVQRVGPLLAMALLEVGRQGESLGIDVDYAITSPRPELADAVQGEALVRRLTPELAAAGRFPEDQRRLTIAVSDSPWGVTLTLTSPGFPSERIMRLRGQD